MERGPACNQIPKPIDPDEDPDTDFATTPDEVEHDSERDQAEGGDEPSSGELEDQ